MTSDIQQLAQAIQSLNSIPPDMVTVLQNLVQAVNALNETVAAVFPQGEAVTSSAGSSSGDFLTVTAPNGGTYKLDLLDVS
jgi:hypothetical protein